MKVLVTGGAGYLGSAVVATLLSRDHSVRVIDSLPRGTAGLQQFLLEERFELVRGDLRDLDVSAAAVDGMEAVVHLAAIGGEPVCARDPILCQEVNVQASRQLFNVASRQGIGRFIFASTCSNYGRLPSDIEYATEESELKPISLYAETKVAIEEVLQRAGVGTDHDPTILRFATLFGMSPRMRFDLTVNEFTMRLLLERELSVYEGYSWRPYIHVADAARAVAMVLDAPPSAVAGQVFNVGDTTQNYQKLKIVDLICKHLSHAVRVERLSGRHDPRDYRVSFDKISRVLGFRPAWKVEDGIREIIAAIQSGAIVDPTSPCYRN